MSIDSLGRVIVGSGHFIERLPGIIAQVTNISVGSGHLQNISHAAQRAPFFSQTDDAAWRWTRLAVDDSIPETLAEYHERVRERLERLGEAGTDIVEAYGWAYSGDLQSAWEKLVDAAVKTGEVFIENATNPPPAR